MTDVADSEVLNPVKLCPCGAEVRWVRTAAGKRMMVELEGSTPSDHTYDASRHISHFAKCPLAHNFRRPRAGRT